MDKATNSPAVKPAVQGAAIEAQKNEGGSAGEFNGETGNSLVDGVAAQPAGTDAPDNVNAVGGAGLRGAGSLAVDEDGQRATDNQPASKAKPIAGTRPDERVFEETLPGEQPVDDDRLPPEIRHARSLLTAPGHAPGYEMPIPSVSALEQIGFFHVGVDMLGRVWRVERRENAGRDAALVLVLAGHLVK